MYSGSFSMSFLILWSSKIVLIPYLLIRTFELETLELDNLFQGQ